MRAPRWAKNKGPLRQQKTLLHRKNGGICTCKRFCGGGPRAIRSEKGIETLRGLQTIPVDSEVLVIQSLDEKKLEIFLCDFFRGNSGLVNFFRHGVLEFVDAFAGDRRNWKQVQAFPLAVA